MELKPGAQQRLCYGSIKNPENLVARKLRKFRPLGGNKPGASTGACQLKEMLMDRPHSKKAEGQYHQTGTNMESIRKMPWWNTEAYVEEVGGSRHEGRRIHLEWTREGNPKSCTVGRI